MFVGAILTGGSYWRHEEQQKLLPEQIREMRKVCHEVLIVTDQPDRYLKFNEPDVRIIKDIYGGKGPLGGLHAALKASSEPDVWVAGGHLPKLSSVAARAMLEWKHETMADAVIPSGIGGIEPLHGIYDVESADVIPVLIDANHTRVEEFLHLLFWREAGPEFFLQRGIAID